MQLETTEQIIVEWPSLMQLSLPNLPEGWLQRLQPHLMFINPKTAYTYIRSLCKQVSLFLSV